MGGGVGGGGGKVRHGVVRQVGCLCGLPVTFRCCVNSSRKVWGPGPPLQVQLTAGSWVERTSGDGRGLGWGGVRGRLHLTI